MHDPDEGAWVRTDDARLRQPAGGVRARHRRRKTSRPRRRSVTSPSRHASICESEDEVVGYGAQRLVGLAELRSSKERRRRRVRGAGSVEHGVKFQVGADVLGLGLARADVFPDAATAASPTRATRSRTWRCTRMTPTPRCRTTTWKTPRPSTTVIRSDWCGRFFISPSVIPRCVFPVRRYCCCGGGCHSSPIRPPTRRRGRWRVTRAWPGVPEVGARPRTGIVRRGCRSGGVGAELLVARHRADGVDVRSCRG